MAGYGVYSVRRSATKVYGFPDEVEGKTEEEYFFGGWARIIANMFKRIFMEWSFNDMSGTITSVVLASVAVIYKVVQTMNEVKNLGKRVDRLETKVDEILFILSHKFKRRLKR